MKYVNIHTHKCVSSVDVVAVHNLSLFQAEKQFLPEISGFFSIGIHPWDADKTEKNFYGRMDEMAKDKRFVLIGECGLDKKCGVSLDRQMEVFEDHIRFSEQLHKPLIIHCVGCFNELMECRKKHNATQRWIVHGFRGKPQLAVQLLKAGMDLSFGEKLNEESVKVTPLEHLFLETDESPIAIETIYERIALLKGCKPEELTAGNELLGVF